MGQGRDLHCFGNHSTDPVFDFLLVVAIVTNSDGWGIGFSI